MHCRRVNSCSLSQHIRTLFILTLCDIMGLRRIPVGSASSSERWTNVCACYPLLGPAFGWAGEMVGACPGAR